MFVLTLEKKSNTDKLTFEKFFFLIVFSNEEEVESTDILMERE